jgi:hypothetical protein
VAAEHADGGDVERAFNREYNDKKAKNAFSFVRESDPWLVPHAAVISNKQKTTAGILLL